MWTSLPRPSCLLTPLVCLTLAVAGCAPSVGPPITQAPTTPPGVASPPMTQSATAAPPADLGPAPADLHQLDWASVHVPGDFCAIPAVIELQGGEAMATSRKFGRVHLGSMQEVTYGDIDGDGRPEAALKVECDNNGGTADGQLGFGAVILTSRHGRLVALGSITPQEQASDAIHVTLLADVQIQRGSVVVHESWYRATDTTCCPTGTALTTWNLHGDQLSPGTPEITS